jgi:hypothetical protein
MPPLLSSSPLPLEGCVVNIMEGRYGRNRQPRADRVPLGSSGKGCLNEEWILDLFEFGKDPPKDAGSLPQTDLDSFYKQSK